MNFIYPKSEVAKRVLPSSGKQLCDLIQLTDEEKKLYTGCGMKLAIFNKSGTLQEFFDPGDVPYNPDVRPTTEQFLAIIMDYYEVKISHNFEVWLVMCSGMQLCEPRMITIHDPTSIPHMLRLCAEGWEDGFWEDDN